MSPWYVKSIILNVRVPILVHLLLKVLYSNESMTFYCLFRYVQTFLFGCFAVIHCRRKNIFIAIIVLKLCFGKMAEYLLTESTNLCLILLPKEKILVKRIFTLSSPLGCIMIAKSCSLFTLFFILLYSTINSFHCEIFLSFFQKSYWFLLTWKKKATMMYRNYEYLNMFREEP